MGSSRNTLLFKLVIFLWFFCTVLGEHQKRDVHRIIIQERAPRSHKKGQAHKHERGRGQGSSKKGKSPQRNEEDYESYEDGGSSSRESSYEEIFYGRNKLQKPHYKKKTSHNRPSYPANLAFEETRQHQYKQELNPHFNNEWVPLNSDQIFQNSPDNHRNNDKGKKRKESKNKSRKQQNKNTRAEHTTSYPIIHVDTSTVYPISAFSGAFPDYNRLLEVNNSPLITTFEQPKIDFLNSKVSSNRLRNHRASYDVTEANEPEIDAFILVPDHKGDKKSFEHGLEDVETQKQLRNRRTITYGKPKF
ncbi:hypothetical protein JTB14_013684 [Gonioctena quinquepunctata]|nr:hypothetical protein JTB14_013684 [Gonioctena quinquepunctata]